jgi:dephospho-CoA kinase
MTRQERDAREVIPTKPLIGLAGGIGSGKTTVASMLKELGAAVISSDALNRDVLETPEVRRAIGQWWGVLRTDGSVDRAALRRVISANPEARQRLERLTHPLVAERRLALTAQYAADPQTRAVVWDSPLLFEAGLAAECDAVIFVEADESVRRERVARERGWTPDELRRLEETQKPLDFKRASADYKVVNNSDRDALRPQVERVFSQILSGSK